MTSMAAIPLGLSENDHHTAVASHGTSAGGLDVGAGFTIRLTSMGWKFFVESRYNYAWSSFIPTTVIPVSIGFRFN
jgi:hypothetical protein